MARQECQSNCGHLRCESYEGLESPECVRDGEGEGKKTVRRNLRRRPYCAARCFWATITITPSLMPSLRKSAEEDYEVQPLPSRILSKVRKRCKKNMAQYSKKGAQHAGTVLLWCQPKRRLYPKISLLQKVPSHEKTWQERCKACCASSGSCGDGFGSGASGGGASESSTTAKSTSANVTKTASAVGTSPLLRR